MFEDKVLVCKDCGQEFTFTAGEQEFYAEKGFDNAPARCKACRRNRKPAARGESGRVMYDAICAECGRPTKVPFEPKTDKPIYNRFLNNMADGLRRRKSSCGAVFLPKRCVEASLNRADPGNPALLQLRA